MLLARDDDRVLVPGVAHMGEHHGEIGVLQRHWLDMDGAAVVDRRVARDGHTHMHGERRFRFCKYSYTGSSRLSLLEGFQPAFFGAAQVVFCAGIWRYFSFAALPTPTKNKGPRTSASPFISTTTWQRSIATRPVQAQLLRYRLRRSARPATARRIRPFRWQRSSRSAAQQDGSSNAR